MNESQIITAVLQTCQVNKVYVGGDLFFKLAFMTEEQLRAMCKELHIKV